MLGIRVYDIWLRNPVGIKIGLFETGKPGLILFEDACIIFRMNSTVVEQELLVAILSRIA
jgi:hypothetical protein